MVRYDSYALARPKPIWSRFLSHYWWGFSSATYCTCNITGTTDLPLLYATITWYKVITDLAVLHARHHLDISGISVHFLSVHTDTLVQVN